MALRSSTSGLALRSPPPPAPLRASFCALSSAGFSRPTCSTSESTLAVSVESHACECKQVPEDSYAAWQPTNPSSLGTGFDEAAELIPDSRAAFPAMLATVAAVHARTWHSGNSGAPQGR